MIFQKLFGKKVVTNKILSVTIRSKTKLLYQKNAKSVSLENALGPLDILPLHENFISSTSGIITVIGSSGNKWTTTHKAGIVKVKSNIVEIALIDI